MTTKKLLLVAATALAAAAVLAPTKCLSKTITIAVVDTGIDAATNTKLCKYGHKSFVDLYPLRDNGGHGTHVAGLIKKYAGKGNYCIVSVKWWAPHLPPEVASENMRRAIAYANNINADFINVSGGGNTPSSGERAVVEQALNRKATFVVAAGNEYSNLDNQCDYFPACYDKRLVVVGNLHDSIQLNREPSSNFGSYVNRWEVGTNVVSDFPGKRKAVLTGTSQAAAIATGKLVRLKLSSRK